MADSKSGSFKDALAAKAGKFAGSRFVRAIILYDALVAYSK